MKEIFIIILLELNPKTFEVAGLEKLFAKIKLNSYSRQLHMHIQSLSSAVKNCYWEMRWLFICTYIYIYIYIYIYKYISELMILSHRTKYIKYLELYCFIF